MIRHAVLACLVLTGCTGSPYSSSSHTWEDSHVVIVNGVRLDHPRTLAATSEHPPRALDLSYGSADLTVIGIPGATGASAEAEIVEKEPGDADLVLTGTGISLTSRGGFPVHLRRLTLKIPAGTPATLKTSMGAIHLSGLAGVPFIRLQASSGDIEIRGVSDVASLEARATMGNITLAGGRGISGTSIETSSGDATLEDLEQAGELTVQTSMGNVIARRIQAERSVTFKSSSGNQTLESVRAPSADLTASMGHIRVLGSDFDRLKARTSSGDIDCRTSTYRGREFKTGMGTALEGTLSP